MDNSLLYRLYFDNIDCLLPSCVSVDDYVKILADGVNQIINGYLKNNYSFELEDLLNRELLSVVMSVKRLQVFGRLTIEDIEEHIEYLAESVLILADQGY